MSSKRLRQRVPSASFVTIATLHCHQLRFHKKGRDGSGKCDIHHTDNHEHAVIGVVFEISNAEKSALDRIEGVGYGYDSKKVEVRAYSGAILQAYTYYATDIDAALKPYLWYKEHVLVGACEHGLQPNYIDRIIAIAAIPDPSPQRHQRELAIYAASAPVNMRWHVY